MPNLMSAEEERINGLLAEIRVLENTFNELTARQNLLERALIESRAAIDAINGLGSSNVEEVLIPIGGGVLVRSKPPITDKILINIGSNVVVEKNKEGSVEIMERRVHEFEQTIIAILNQRNQIAQRLEADRQAVQVLVSGQTAPRQ